MTSKPAIKLDDIQVTYSRSPNIKDMLGEIKKSISHPDLYYLNHVGNQDA